MIRWRPFHGQYSLTRRFSTGSRSPFEVLGVDPSTSQEEIKARFRELAKKYHPDLNTHDKDASKKMADITNAYDILTDKRKRQEYERNRPGASASSDTTTGSAYNSNAEWVDSTQMFSEFSNIFGRMGRHRSVGRVAMKGEDLSASVVISLVEAMNGCVKPISYKAKSTCDTCKGSGANPGTGWSSCKLCKGTGTQRVERGIMTMGMPCVRCSGSGQVLEHPCTQCKGEGLSTEVRDVSLKVPAGVKNQMELRLQGQGHCGTRGGRSGDLFVTIKIKPDDYFTLIDDDVYVSVPLTIKEVLTGANVEVRQIDGRSTMKVNIPPGTAPGTTNVIKGKGPPRASGISSTSRGDMILKFSLTMQPPESLTTRQKELIDEFDSIQRSILSRNSK
jgi:molecular chaperone DnaJ